MVERGKGIGWMGKDLLRAVEVIESMVYQQGVVEFG
jgi:hypothetical protein